MSNKGILSTNGLLTSLPCDVILLTWLQQIDLYPQVTCIQIQVELDCDITKLTCIHKWPVSRYKWCLWLWLQEIDLNPQVTCIQIQVGAYEYECDVTKLTCIHNWPVSSYNWCLWQRCKQTDLYPQVSCIQVQVGCREQSRCIQTFNRGCFKLRGILKFLRRFPPPPPPPHPYVISVWMVQLI